ncbi:MAG: hypothetical protein M0P12_01195 [Paludibacteraceae bacterium]|nr:hypothetical protein [Paludibacteraceae bacterium]MCK9615537.1 hypothetical protein [Candidatus Omnitrophota bacterium]
MNTVVIPCFNRSEYLELCLEFIMKADGWNELKYIFATDIGVTSQVLGVINRFKGSCYLVSPDSHNFKIGKQSKNVITGLLSEHCKEADHVFYIEDDVFIGKDFFTFGEAIIKKTNSFAVILSKNANGKDSVCEDINSYYCKTDNQYQGIGVCFNNVFLKKYLSPHNEAKYFANPLKYILGVFPKSKLNASFCEQDGLIRRIIEENKLKVAFAHVPRCFHAGFYGYHRNPKGIDVYKMTSEQRKATILKNAFDIDSLREIVKEEGMINDSLPVDLETSHNDCYEVSIEH